MVDLANVVVKGEFDGQELIAGLKQVSKLGKESAKNTDLTNAAMGKLSETMSLLGADVKNAIGVLTEGFNTLGKKLDTQTQNFNRLTTSVRKAKKEYKDFNNVRKEAAGIADKTLGTNARGAAQANRFNSSNFLAQFQDIAVTSAMGMNPMLIAMQQGTQLQYILANSNAPLKDFIAGLKSAFSGVGLLAVGLTGLVAALIQMVDWSSVGKNLLKGLSDVFAFVADNADIFTVAITTATATLVVFNGSAILGAIVNLGKLGLSALAAGTKMAFAWVLAAGPISLLIGAITGLIYIFMKFPDKIANALNNAIDFIVGFVNKAVGYFKGLYDVIKQMPTLIKIAWDEGRAAHNKKIREIMDNAINATYIDTSGLKQKVTNVVQGTSDIINNIGGKISNVIKTAASKASQGLSETSESLDKTTAKIKTAKTEVDKLAEAWDRLQTSSQNKINDLVMQQGLIGAGTYEKTYIQTLNDSMRQAQSAGLDLYSTGANGKTIYETLNENAKATAALTEANEKLNASYDFTKSTVKGFFTDMRHGLRDGQSAWEAFGNAVNNVLDKILDKIMDIGVDALFSAGTGYFGKSAMGGYGLFGGLGASTSTTGIGGLQVGQTSGNLTYLGNIAGAANGGVFSNGVYNSPTLFKFGKGGKFGVMGEAGPEAVMPLTRGPDGSLGVRADNANASPVIVNVINNSDAQAKVEQRQTSQGMEIDVMIDQLVAEKMNQPGTSSNNALRAFNNQKLIAR